ncbi:MAG: restriction endonuclease subunit S [Spirochaetaceae bacterium]|nr:restriction endonuclease subunit S [Spirochaetaceae bacterium]
MVEECLLKSINFVDLEKWYVEYYLREIHLKSKFELIKLRKIISPKKNLIKKDDYKGDIPIVDKIVFKTGDIVFRKEKKTGMNLYSLDNEELLVSNINFHQGATALNTFGKIVASTHYQPYSINTEIIDPIYLVKILRSEPFLKMVSGKKAQGIKNESGYDFIGNFKIPVPSISEQKAIIQKYQDTISKAEAIEKEAEKADKGIDDFIFLKLGIKEVSLGKNNDSILKTSSFSNLYNWDVKHSILNISPQTLLKSNLYKNIPIQSVFEINPLTQIPKDIDKITFLPMECISDISGTVIEKRIIDSKTKGYTKFKDNDVIFAKITPCMQNGKCAVVQDLLHGYGMGSTEFHVFRAIREDILPEYLHSLLRTTMLRRTAMNFFTGSSGQQRVSSEFIKNLFIPLPPLPVQNEIVEHINQIKAQVKDLRQQAKELREKAKLEFERSVFE